MANYVVTLLLKDYSSPHLTPKTSHAQNDSAWDSVRIVEHDADGAFATAAGARFVVKTVRSYQRAYHAG